MTKYLVITLSLAVILFAACSKKATPSADTYKDWLRNSKWRIASGTLTMKKPNGQDTILNYLNWIPTCNKDDYFGFNTATTGAFFNGSVLCAPSDPDSISFTYQLSDDNKYLSLYCSDHLYYSVTETVLPYVFDTLQWNPSLVLDTIYGALDTPLLNPVIKLDTIWNLNFAATPVSNINIVNAPITNFTANSFTLYFTLKAQYPDTTNNQTGKYYFTDALGNADSADVNTIIRVDTFKYLINYTTH